VADKVLLFPPPERKTKRVKAKAGLVARQSQSRKLATDLFVFFPSDIPMML
jgi:hypothetical protein